MFLVAEYNTMLSFSLEAPFPKFNLPIDLLTRLSPIISQSRYAPTTPSPLPLPPYYALSHQLPSTLPVLLHLTPTQVTDSAIHSHYRLSLSLFHYRLPLPSPTSMSTSTLPLSPPPPSWVTVLAGNSTQRRRILTAISPCKLWLK